MKKLFIFDLDGVLTSTSNEHFLAWTLLGKELNISIDKSVEEKTKGVSRLDSLEIILSEYNLENSYSLEEKIILANKKNKMYKQLINRYSPTDLFEGVIELFEYLKTKNVLIALGSASMNGPKLINNLGINKYFDYFVDPSKNLSKPSPSIFLDAMNHFSLTSEECVGVEDAISGIEAINCASMYSIGIGTIENLDKSNIVFSSIKEIEFDWLEKLIEGNIL